MLSSFTTLTTPDGDVQIISLFQPTPPLFSHDSPPVSTYSSPHSPFGFHLFSFLPSQTMAAPHRAAKDPATAQSGLSIPSALEAFVAEGDGLEVLDDIVDEDIAACTVSFALRRPGRVAYSWKKVMIQPRRSLQRHQIPSQCSRCHHFRCCQLAIGHMPERRARRIERP